MKLHLRAVGCHLPIWDQWSHSVLAIRHKWTHLHLNYNQTSWYSIYLTQRDGRLS